jgi:hypothetical protein
VRVAVALKVPVCALPPETVAVPVVNVGSVPHTNDGVVDTTPAPIEPFRTADVDVTDDAAAEVAVTAGAVHVTVAIPSPRAPYVLLVALAVTVSTPTFAPV